MEPVQMTFNPCTDTCKSDTTWMRSSAQYVYMRYSTGAIVSHLLHSLNCRLPHLDLLLSQPCICKKGATPLTVSD